MIVFNLPYYLYVPTFVSFDSKTDCFTLSD